jgi:Fanconi anemia group M protein
LFGKEEAEEEERERRKKLVRMNPESSKKFVFAQFIRPNTLEERKYQLELSEMCFLENTLVVLPTGLGKTAIALLTISKFLSKDLRSRCLVLAPTRVLVHQHYKFLLDHLDLEPDQIGMLTGEDSLEARNEAWKKKVVCATPQVTVSDIRRGKCDLGSFSLVVFDEAHRATGNHAYTTIASLYGELRKDQDAGRIMGITASLPSDKSKVEEILSKLKIKKIEIRDETSEDVKPYVFKTEAHWVEVELSPVLKSIQKLIREALDQRLKMIEDASLIKRNRYGSITLKDLLRLRMKVDEVKSSQLRNALFSSIRLLHALNLIETQSLSAFKSFADRLLARRRGYGMAELLNDRRFIEAYEQARGALVAGIEHPKMEEVFKILRQMNEGERALVFASYRDTVDQIHAELVKRGFRAGYLIGKSGQSGQSQRKQVQALEDLRSGVYDILVATQVGEEGLDVAECNFVIFYDNVPSAVRFVQRKGRTGRRSQGKVYILMTKGTKDEAYYWLSRKRLGDVKKIAGSFSKDKEENKKGPMDEFFNLNSGEDGGNDSPSVLVDTREASHLAERLRSRGARVEVRQLEVGDFVLSSETAVERKTLDDFVKSVYDGRLFKQLSIMSEKYPRPILIVQGEKKHLRGISEPAFYGALASVITDFRIPIYFASDEKDVCELLFRISQREQLERKKEMRVREGRKPSALSEIQKYVVAGIPGVDSVLADRLLSQIGTVRDVFNSEEGDLMKVEGIGSVMARRIRELATAKYQPNNFVKTELGAPGVGLLSSGSKRPQATFDEIVSVQLSQAPRTEETEDKIKSEVEAKGVPIVEGEISSADLAPIHGRNPEPASLSDTGSNGGELQQIQSHPQQQHHIDLKKAIYDEDDANIPPPPLE